MYIWRSQASTTAQQTHVNFVRELKDLPLLLPLFAGSSHTRADSANGRGWHANRSVTFWLSSTFNTNTDIQYFDENLIFAFTLSLHFLFETLQLTGYSVVILPQLVGRENDTLSMDVDMASWVGKRAQTHKLSQSWRKNYVSGLLISYLFGILRFTTPPLRLSFIWNLICERDYCQSDGAGAGREWERKVESWMSLKRIKISILSFGPLTHSPTCSKGFSLSQVTLSLLSLRAIFDRFQKKRKLILSYIHPWEGSHGCVIFRIFLYISGIDTIILLGPA